MGLARPSIGHHKTDMGQGQPVLRSGDPEGVLQEMWALFAVSTRPICSSPSAGAAAMSSPEVTASRTPCKPRPPRCAAAPWSELDLALAAFLMKILMPGFFVRDRPDRASPRKTKKAGDFPARKPGEPSVTNVTRKIQFHLLYPWQIT